VVTSSRMRRFLLYVAFVPCVAIHESPSIATEGPQSTKISLVAAMLRQGVQDRGVHDLSYAPVFWSSRFIVRGVVVLLSSISDHIFGEVRTGKRKW